MPKNTIYWVTQDLRLSDNAVLTFACDSASLLCVYIVDPEQFKERRWQSCQTCSHRWSFIQSSLSDFNRRLLAIGQQLYVMYGNTLEILTELATQNNTSHIVTTRLPGTDERAVIERLNEQFPQLTIHQVDNYTLFTPSTLPFSIDNIPDTFSKFRRKVEHLPTLAPAQEIKALPPKPFVKPKPSLVQPDWLPKAMGATNQFVGGEIAGTRHLQAYFGSELPSHYKTVRNSIDGWNNSSKLSPWLNLGCISPRQVRSYLSTYEIDHGRNSSTQWLYLELLWREYFQWLHHKIGIRLFKFSGITQSPPKTSFYAERFNRWRYGSTPYPLVNACMNELRHTGFLSNRGRQIAASCLVNELAIDWRYGAAWFEHMLIDYNVAVNWGNWQYIAGVGVDPKGGRHFDLDKQTALFDPDGSYREKWQGQSHAILVSVDAADWPIANVTEVIHGRT